MIKLIDGVELINSGELINAETLNKPTINLASKVDIALADINSKIEETLTLEEKTKLSEIEDGAQVNVNSDWDAETGDEQILNKPILGTLSSLDSGEHFDQVRTNAQSEGYFVVQVLGKDLSDENFTSSQKEKVDFLSVTKPINLDEVLSTLDGLSASVVLKGEWDASLGAFPEDAKTGYSYIVAVPGVVDGVDFQKNDRLLAISDSGITYEGNWLKLDYTDQVLSVAGKQGNVSLTRGDIEGLGSLSGLDSGTESSQVRTNLQSENYFVAKELGKGLISDSQLQKLDEIEAGAQANVNPDWDSLTGDSQIRNKPTGISLDEAIQGTSEIDRLWSAEKVHAAARSISDSIRVSEEVGSISETDGGKILIKNMNSDISQGLPIGWNVIIAAEEDIRITLGGFDIVLENSSSSFTIPKGIAVSATKIKTNLWLVHQLRLQLKVGV